MARLRIARQAWADIEDVQRYTEENFGPAQRVAYERLQGERV